MRGPIPRGEAETLRGQVTQPGLSEHDLILASKIEEISETP